MRLTTLITLMLLAVTPASAQHPYDLDPYKPSDAAWLRNYGATLVGLTPLLELRKLDPYVPSQAALLRQLGGAMPLWVGWYPPFSPTPTFAPLTPFPKASAVIPTGPSVVVIIASPSNRLSPPPQLQDRQREPDQLHRPELRPAPPKNPGFRAAQRTGSGGLTLLFLAQKVGSEEELPAASLQDEHLGLHLTVERER